MTCRGDSGGEDCGHTASELVEGLGLGLSASKLPAFPFAVVCSPPSCLVGGSYCGPLYIAQSIIKPPRELAGPQLLASAAAACVCAWGWLA